QEAHIVAHFNGLRFPDPEALYAEAQIWTNEYFSSHGRRTVLYSSNGVYRDGCDYNLYFGSWSCPRRGLTYYVNVYVTDQTGYTVMRTTTGYCADQPPKITPPSGCLNGGADPYRNGTCVCTPDYSGKQCEVIRCQHQGTSRGSYCDCPTLWTGKFCEIASCGATDNQHNFTPNRRSMHFIVHDGNNVLTALGSVIRTAHEVISDITAQHPRWLVHYTVSRFNDT
ncbi:Protein T25C12.3, partial [Aphelenchoides avenae]